MNSFTGRRAGDQNLFEFANKHGALSEHTLHAIAKQLLMTLKFLHSKNVALKFLNPLHVTIADNEINGASIEVKLVGVQMLLWMQDWQRM